jgi:hypothetical protein
MAVPVTPRLHLQRPLTRPDRGQVIRLRILKGGHAVPEDKFVERFWRSPEQMPSVVAQHVTRSVHGPRPNPHESGGSSVNLKPGEDSREGVGHPQRASCGHVKEGVAVVGIAQSNDAAGGGGVTPSVNVAEDALDNAWHVARRHAHGPAEFSHLSLRLRHLLHATATALAGPAALRSSVFGSGTSPADGVAAIHRALQPRDGAEFSEHPARWEGGTGC